MRDAAADRSHGRRVAHGLTERRASRPVSSSHFARIASSTVNPWWCATTAAASTTSANSCMMAFRSGSLRLHTSTSSIDSSATFRALAPLGIGMPLSIR